MPGPFSNPTVTLESDEPVAGTRSRMAAVRVKGVGTDPETIQKVSTMLTALRYGGTITTTPTESTKGAGFFVLHYQGKPITQEEVEEAVRSQAMWKVTRKVLGH